MVFPQKIISKESLFLKNIELWILLVIVLIPFGKLVFDGIELSNRISQGGVVGVGKSPWFANRIVDLGDSQLRTFLFQLPLLVIVSAVFVILRKLLQKVDNSLNAQLWYYVIFGLGHALYLHGGGILFLISMIAFNYILVILFIRTRGFPLITWFFNLSFLLITEYYHGYKFAWISESLGYLDGYQSVMDWNRVNNLILLKVISFQMDYYWKLTNRITLTHEKHRVKCDECAESIHCLKFRMESHANNYSFMSFVAYMFYPPLYLAGPTITYNAWISQVQIPQQTYNTKRMIIYFLRFLIMF